MMNTENNTVTAYAAETSKCRNCGRVILDGELVKVSWNDFQDEHISCPPASPFAQAAR